MFCWVEFKYGFITIFHLFPRSRISKNTISQVNLSKFLTLSYDRTCPCHHVLLRILVQANTFGFWYWYFLNMGEDFLYFTSSSMSFWNSSKTIGLCEGNFLKSGEDSLHFISSSLGLHFVDQITSSLSMAGCCHEVLFN